MTLTFPLEHEDFIAALFIFVTWGSLQALTTALLFTPKIMVTILRRSFEDTTLLPLALIALCAFYFVDHYNLSCFSCVNEAHRKQQMR